MTKKSKIIIFLVCILISLFLAIGIFLFLQKKPETLSKNLEKIPSEV